MKIIKPISFMPSMLVSSNIAASSLDDWSDTATYASGSEVVADNVDGIQHEYLWYPPDEDQVDATSEYPPSSHSVLRRRDMNASASSTDDNYRCYWIDKGPTDRYGMFSKRSRRVSANQDSIVAEIAPGSFFNSLALINTKADDVNITATDPIEGELLNQDINMLDLSNVYDPYTWCFAPVLKKSTIILTGLPAYLNSRVRVTATNDGDTAQIGEFVFGQLIDIGTMLYGASISGSNYASPSTDDYGVASLSEGTYSREINYPVRCQSSRMEYIDKTMEDIRATPTVFIGVLDRMETVVYGICEDFSEVLQGELHSDCNITAKEFSL